MKTIKLMYLVLFVALFVGSCAKKEEPKPNPNPNPNPTGSSPVANFTFTPASGVAPLQVQFTNTSTGATSYVWTLGNGQTSTDTNPVAIYPTAGTYDVILSARAANGQMAVKTAKITVTAPAVAAPVANFTFTPNTGAAPLQVTFTNTSTNATSFAWDFGNGQTSTVANASTTYAAAGTYSIRLTATGANGQTNVRTASITVTAPVVQTYEFKDKWISAGGMEPKSYRNHHYTFEVKEEMDFRADLTSSVNVALYLYNELDILGGNTNGFSTSASLTGKLKAGKYRLIVVGVKNSEVPYVLTFTGKYAARPEKVVSQYQQIIGKWTYSNNREPFSASNRHYDLEVTQDSQLDVILNSSVPTKISIINELGFKTDVTFGQNSTLADISLKKGKYRIVAYTTGSGLEANFVLNIFGLFANVTEIKSIEQQLTGSWTSSSNLATSPNNPKYNIEITQDSMLDIVLFGAATNLNSRFYVLNDKGDIVGNFPGYGQQLLREVINLKKGVYTIVPATSSNGWTSNFTLTVYGHHISNFRLK
jgi:PKD repeat protein